MFCRLCGSKLSNDALFCPQCGARTDAAHGAGEPQPPYSGAGGPTAPGAPVSPYYAQEFASIAAGNPPRFNVAAFFLGPWHMLYRGCGKRFCRLYLPYLIVCLLSGVFSLVQYSGTLNQVLSGNYSITALPAFLPAWLISVCLWLWGLGLAIYNGVTFNRKYYEQVQANPAARTHAGWVAALAGGWAAVYIVGMVIVVVATVNQVNASGYAPFDDYAGYGDSSGTDGYAYDGTVAAILRDYAQAMPEQAAYNGYVPDALLGGTLTERIEGSYMFYSDEISIGALLQAVPSTVTDTGVSADGYETADATFVVGGTDVHLLFTLQGPYIWVTDAYTQRTGSTDGASYWLGEDEMSAIALYLYAQASPNSAATASLARQIRGTWVAVNGNEVTMDALWFGDIYYTLGTMRDGKIQVWISETDDPDLASYYLFSLDETGRTLTVEACDGADTLLRTDIYTRQIA